MEYIKFKTESFVVIIENEIYGGMVETRIVYPITSKHAHFTFDVECDAKERSDYLVERMSHNFRFFRDILFNFNHYKRCIDEYRIKRMAKVAELLSQNERDVFLESLATNYFHKSFLAVPSPPIKMELFVAMLELPSVELFKHHFAPEMSLATLTIKKQITLHKSIKNEFYREELFDFSKQLN